MKGKRIKQINNMIITQETVKDGKSKELYHVYTKEGRELYTSIYLNDIEEKCKSYTAYTKKGQKQEQIKNDQTAFHKERQSIDAESIRIIKLAYDTVKQSNGTLKIDSTLKKKFDITRTDDEILSIWLNIINAKAVTEKQMKYGFLAKAFTLEHPKESTKLNSSSKLSRLDKLVLDLKNSWTKNKSLITIVPYYNKNTGHHTQIDCYFYDEVEGEYNRSIDDYDMPSYYMRKIQIKKDSFTIFSCIETTYKWSMSLLDEEYDNLEDKGDTYDGTLDIDDLLSFSAWNVNINESKYKKEKEPTFARVKNVHRVNGKHQAIFYGNCPKCGADLEYECDEIECSNCGCLLDWWGDLADL